MAEILVLFHSTGGNTVAMANAVAKGIDEVAGADATVKQVPEIAEAPRIQGPEWRERRLAFQDLPTASVEELTSYDGIAFGTPVHFGSMSAAMRSFLDQTGAFWMQGALIGKPATVFVSAGSGGGRESAILSLWSILAVHGMTIVPLGLRAPELSDQAGPHGASPFGAGTIAAGPGERPSEAELAAARVQGAALAETAVALAKRSAGRSPD